MLGYMMHEKLASVINYSGKNANSKPTSETKYGLVKTNVLKVIVGRY